MTKLLQDRVAIVTGSGRGLGRSHALELARHGARVVVNDIGACKPGSPAEGVVKEIQAMGGEAFAHDADVTKSDQVEAMVAGFGLPAVFLLHPADAVAERLEHFFGVIRGTIIDDDDFGRLIGLRQRALDGLTQVAGVIVIRDNDADER